MSSTSKFKLGDRVVAIAPCDKEPNFIGVTGTVNYISGGILSVLVEFDRDVDTRMGMVNFWYCEKKSLRLLKDIEEELDDELYI